ncbi:MAG: NAD(P)/FAD-dependent oxidoreductase [Tranquillimonas sp.]
METVDVTVKGAGVFGLSVAYACLRAGARVRVVDPAGVAAGASGGVVGALAPHAPDGWNDKKQFQFDSLCLSERFWPEIDALSGLSSGYGRVGRVQPVSDDRGLALARAREATARGLWQGRADWRIRPAAELGAWAPAGAAGFVVQDTLSARLHPLRATRSLAGAVRALGAEIVPRAADAGAVVWATGAAGLEDLSRRLGRSAGVGVKGQAGLLAHDAGAAPQIYADGIHIVPHDDGTVGIGSTTERDFDDPGATDGALDAVIARARTICPALEGAPVVARWAALRPRAASRAPLLGPWPDRPGHYVANGGFKIGFGMAPLVGRVMADLVLEGRDAVPPAFRLV